MHRLSILILGLSIGSWWINIKCFIYIIDMWMVYLAKMKYFCIGGELFFSAQAGDYVCAVKAAIAGDTGCFFV